MRPPSETAPRAACEARPTGLIAIDLDGTLLDAGGMVTPRATAAVGAAAARGWHLVVATGRPPQLVSSFGSALDGVSHVVATNGSMIATFPDGEPLHALTFDIAVARDLVRRLRALDPEFGFALATDAGFAHEPGFAERMPAPVGPGGVDDVLSLDGTEAIKLFAYHARRSVDDLLRDLPAVLDRLGFVGIGVTHLGADAVELGPGDRDKAAGLAWLCARVGVDRQRVIAIGDERNDVTMLRWAAVGVAVANASADVRAAADHVIPAHTDDGVARFLEALVDGTISLF